MRRFDRDHSGAGSAEFLSWMRENPEQFFVNICSPRFGRLHRADCRHMKFRVPETVNFVSRAKMIDPSRSALEAWALKHEIELRPCHNCDV